MTLLRSRIGSAMAVATLLTLAPLAAQQAPRVSAPYEMFTLPNGLTVILHEDHSVPMVTVNVWYHAGSAREKFGRTGFAHLFEHILFEGSKNVKEGDFDNFLEAAGGTNNGSTTTDRTNYYESVPANALDLALFLESDRMGFLLDVVTPQLVNGQRDVVKNERRQSYENAPYGMSNVRLTELMYPKTHPYYWPVIGYMEDLTAATHEDVKEFFTKYYAPGNASIVIAGDINPAETRKKVEHWFADVKPGPRLAPIEAPPVELTSVIKETMTDSVQLPRLTLAWHSPAQFKPGDAELDVLASVLTGGKNSRLYKRLVYDLQLVQSIQAFQASAALGSRFQIVATARPSEDPPDQVLAKIKTIIDEEIEKLKVAPPAAREVQRALNGIESNFLNSMQQSGDKADLMNAYFFATGNPDYFAEDLGRYLALQPNDIQAAAKKWLPTDRRLELSVHPKGK
ncbi:MAG: insulinase family protein [Acidobacteria bacterium]|nr:insulinase family protein [Acidobacteriota bacterium]